MAVIKIAILFVAMYASTTSALPSCVCTREFEPVCGSDGHTYPNQCQFDCAKSKTPDLTLAEPSRCESSFQSCICTLEYMPVCGTNGVTYGNKCGLTCAQRRGVNTEIKHYGECAKDSEEVKVASIFPSQSCVCTREKKPQCGTDGVTYANDCLLRCAAEKTGVTLAHVGPCEMKPLPPNNFNCACTRNLLPVCGSDGVTYSNPCLLKCAGHEMVRVGPC